RLPGEAVGVAFPGVDDDLEIGQPTGPGFGEWHVRAGLLDRPGRLPEHHLPAPAGREHELRTVLPRPVGHDIDGRTPADTGPQRDPLDDLALAGPRLHRHRVA